MSAAPRRVVVTGAGGFLGERLARRLLSDPVFAGDDIVLGDISLSWAPRNGRVRLIEGDIAERSVREDLIGDGTDLVFHLASILGGAAEANYDLARRVNIDATLSLLEACRCPNAPPRVVFASSIAVFGADAPAWIDDDTPTNPTMVYGAQKRMIEVVLEQFSARGWIDGLAIRLPGIVARPDADARLTSAFLNRVFHAYAAGEDITLPVSAQGTTWMLSAAACVDAFVHAGGLPASSLGPRRAFTLPAQRVAFGDLVEALRVRYPDSVSIVRFAPEAEIEAQFARQPPLSTAIADALGFRHDGDLATLVARAINQEASA